MVPGHSKRHIVKRLDESVQRLTSVEDTSDADDARNYQSIGFIVTSSRKPDDELNSSIESSRSYDDTVIVIEQRETQEQDVGSSWQKRDSYTYLSTLSMDRE